MSQRAPTFGEMMAGREGAPAGAPAVVVPSVVTTAASPSQAKRRASAELQGPASPTGPNKSPRLDATCANLNARGEHVLEAASPRGSGLTPMLRAVDIGLCG